MSTAATSEALEPNQKHEKGNAAAQAVFQTAELLENILFHLPPRKIFEVQKVSHSFKNAIAASIRIQEKVFLRLRHKPERLRDKPERLWKTPNNNLVSPMELSPFLEVHGTRDVSLSTYALWSAQWAGISSWKDSRSISMESSIFDTYVSDPPCWHIFVDHTFNERVRAFGNVDAREGSGLTWRAMMERLLAETVITDHYHNPNRERVPPPLTAAELVDIEKRETGRGAEVSLLLGRTALLGFRGLAPPDNKD